MKWMSRNVSKVEKKRKMGKVTDDKQDILESSHNGAYINDVRF